VDRPPPPSGEYWYLGSQDRAVDALFRRVCALAWPYALLCATRYLHDVHAAYDLMDAAVSNAEEYYERFNGNRTFSQIFHRVLSVLKRISKQRALNAHEVPSGSLPDLERKVHAPTSQPEAEQSAYVRQLLAQMTDRSRKITIWRTEGHTWRQIAGKLKVNHAAVRRAYYRELRRLLSPGSDGLSSLEGED
jgi:RNA polymerase sigma factor (sigma-70 family)